MAPPPPLRHPMERLLCERDFVHDSTPLTHINHNPPPPAYHLSAHFPPPAHRPLYYAELVRLRNVIAFRDGTASARKSDLSRIGADDKTMTKFLVKEVKEATEELEKDLANDRFRDGDSRQESWSEPEESRNFPCFGRCCTGGPPRELDRVIYRFMGEARPNMCLLEAVHFELFLPDRLDLRYLHVQKKVVDKYGLKEGMLVWISSSVLNCVPVRSRYRYRDIADIIPYVVSWRVADIIEIVCKYPESWMVPYHICATICDVDTHKTQQSIYYAGVCSRFAYPVYGRASLLNSTIKPSQVVTATITKREAAWLYSVEPIRNLPLYQRVIENIDSSNTQSGYRVDDFSTEKHELDFCDDEHSVWFSERQPDSEDFIWMMERSLTIGTGMARVDSRDAKVECFGEFNGFLSIVNPPRLYLYPSHENPPMWQRYAILSFSNTITTKLYVVSINSWQQQDKYRVAYGRRSLALEALKREPHVSDCNELPCSIRFADSPTNALDTFLRIDHDMILTGSNRFKLPIVFADLYDVQMPDMDAPSMSSKRSRRVLASILGRRVAKQRCVKFAITNPTTSMAVIGEERAGKSVVGAAVALATPRRHNKLILTTNRDDARNAWFFFLKLFFTDEEFVKCAGEVNAGNIPMNKLPTKTKYEDSEEVDKEDELREFLHWPTEDVVIATIDSVLQVLHHHLKDKEDPLLPFLKNVHTVIIDSAETVTEAYFYTLVKVIHPARVIIIGDHEKAAAISASIHFHKQPCKPILHGIVSYIRPHHLPVYQIKRSEEREMMRTAYYVRAPIKDSMMDGLLKYSQGQEVEKMASVLEFLRQCRVPMKHVVVLTMDEKHQESMKFVCADYDPELKIEEFDNFIGQVRPVVIILGGWYARRYWNDETFLDLYSTFYLDMLIFIGFNNVLNLKPWCELGARRCLVERKLCDFPKKKKN